MNNQRTTPLFEALMKHVQKNPISFHVPGHKYGSLIPTSKTQEPEQFFKNILQIDATELSGLDDYHAPEEAILEAETLLSELYHTEQSFFLVNGSTVGNLAMIMAACQENDIVLVQRNCHKSVLNALRLAKARPIFIEPEYNPDWGIPTGLTVDTIQEAITTYPEAAALILTYPNYYGMVTDIEPIIKLAHQHQIPVLVDEAHGAHFMMGQPFPASAVQLGADVVVQSAHKTLPAMTMGSFLHIKSSLVSKRKVKEYLEIFQSSSPSYPIMASLDLARSYLADYNANDLDELLHKIGAFKEQMAAIPAIRVLSYPNGEGDFLKLTIQSRCGLNGFEIQRRLEEKGIYTELADPFNVLFVLPLLKKGDQYPFEKVASIIADVLKDFSFFEKENRLNTVKESPQRLSELAIPFHQLNNYKTKNIPLEGAVGEVCAEMIIPYPPGIPLLLKGEKITVEKIEQLSHLQSVGARFQGSSQLKNGMIGVYEL